MQGLAIWKKYHLLIVVHCYLLLYYLYIFNHYIIHLAEIMAQHVEITRANWSDPTQRKHFIDLCLHEANSGFRSGGTLKPSSWPRIIKELEKLVGKRFNQKQLKNAWDYMKKQYLTWSRLITMMGDGYNSVTKTFDLPTERWEEYLQVIFLLIQVNF